MPEAWLPALPLLGPLAAAALTVPVRHRPLVSRTVMEAAVGLGAAAALLLFLAVEARGSIVMRMGGWPRPFAIAFVADRFSALMVLVTAVVALAGAVHARAAIGRRRRRAGFDPLFLGLLAAVNGAFLTGDLFNLYVWFELMLVAALGLMLLDRRPAQVAAAFRYAAPAMVAAAAILLGIGIIAAETGTLDMAAAGAVLAGRPPTLAVAAAAALLMGGFALKAGLVPFHLWLPATYPQAPLVVQGIFAGLLTKVGFYAAARVLTALFGTGLLAGMAAALALAGVATMLLCALAALAEQDLRRLLAWHVIAQVGYMATGLGAATAAGVQAAIFFMAHSMLVQTNLFFVAAAAARAGCSLDLRRSGGVVRAQPLLAGLAAVPILSLAGIPPLSGFWAKFGVIGAAFAGQSPWLGIAALIAGLLTIVSMAGVWARVFWQLPTAAGAGRRVPVAMLFSIALLSAATLGIGLAPNGLWQVAAAAAAEAGAGR